MDEQRRAEIKRIVEHFRGKAISQNVLTEYCNLTKVEPIVVGDYKDYLYQVEHDDKILALVPRILKELQAIQYVPEFASANERKQIKERNDVVRVEITKLFEENAIAYRTVDTIGKELGRLIGGTVEMAGQTAFNKALEVLLHLANKEFGSDFNMKHVSDYVLKVFNEAEQKKADNSGK